MNEIDIYNYNMVSIEPPNILAEITEVKEINWVDKYDNSL